MRTDAIFDILDQQSGQSNCTLAAGCISNALPNPFTLRPDIVPGVPLINPSWKKAPFAAIPTPISTLQPSALPARSTTQPSATLREPLPVPEVRALPRRGWQSMRSPGHWNDPDMLEVGNGGHEWR